MCASTSAPAHNTGNTICSPRNRNDDKALEGRGVRMENITTASCSPLLATKQNQEAALEGWRNREKGEVEPGAFCGSPHHRQLMPACRIHSVWVGGGGGPMTIITVLLRDSLMHGKLG